MDKNRNYRNVVSPYFYETGFNPFHPKYNSDHVRNYINQAEKENLNASQFLKKFDHLADINEAIIKKINQLLDVVNLSKNEILRSLFALINEQYIIIQREKDKILTTKSFSAFEIGNAKLSEDRPLPLTSLQEVGVEILNTLASYISIRKVKKNKNQLRLSEKEKIDTLETIIQLTNEYCIIKSHVESCLTLSGDIDFGQDKIMFHANDLKLDLSLNLSDTIINNRGLTNFLHFQKDIEENGFTYFGPKNNTIILDEIIENDSRYSFSLRDKTKKEFSDLFTFEIFIQEYYPHIKEVSIESLENLTFKNLVELIDKTGSFIHGLERSISEKTAENSLKSICEVYTPKVDREILVKYLLAVSTFNDRQINAFLHLLENDGNENFFGSPFYSVNGQYIFPFLSMVGYNPYYLIDHWIEKLKLDPSEKGHKYEKIIKQHLNTIKTKKYNKFRVIDHNKIKVLKKGFQEIDLIIEFDKKILIAEIKCIKYPMNRRDCFTLLTDQLEKAMSQIVIKEQFIIDNKNYIKQKYDFDANKEIVKIILVNYPIFNGYGINGIPIIDFMSLASYLKSEQASIKIFDEGSYERIEQKKYYSCENSFNENLYSYIKRPFDFQFFEEKYERVKLSNELSNIGIHISFDDYRSKL